MRFGDSRSRRDTGRRVRRVSDAEPAGDEQQADEHERAAHRGAVGTAGNAEGQSCQQVSHGSTYSRSA